MLTLFLKFDRCLLIFNLDIQLISSLTSPIVFSPVNTAGERSSPWTSPPLCAYSALFHSQPARTLISKLHFFQVSDLNQPLSCSSLLHSFKKILTSILSHLSTPKLYLVEKGTGAHTILRALIWMIFIRLTGCRVVSQALLLPSQTWWMHLLFLIPPARSWALEILTHLNVFHRNNSTASSSSSSSKSCLHITTWLCQKMCLSVKVYTQPHFPINFFFFLPF